MGTGKLCAGKLCAGKLCAGKLCAGKLCASQGLAIHPNQKGKKTSYRAKLHTHILEVYLNGVKQKITGPKDSPSDITAAKADHSESIEHYVVMPDGSIILVPTK